MADAKPIAHMTFDATASSAALSRQTIFGSPVVPED